jgi:glutaredoxin
VADPILIYSRKQCHLCDEAKAVVEPIARARGLGVEIVDVDSDPKLTELYGLEVPVVFVGGRKAFKYRVDAKKLESLLERAS